MSEDIFEMSKRLIKERDKLLEVVKDIAQDNPCTGEDALAWNNWCKETLKELGYGS